MKQAKALGKARRKKRQNKQEERTDRKKIQGSDGGWKKNERKKERTD